MAKKRIKPEVKEALLDLATQGLNYSEVAEEMNKKGLLTTTGKEWEKTQVSRYLLKLKYRKRGSRGLKRSNKKTALNWPPPPKVVQTVQGKMVYEHMMKCVQIMRKCAAVLEQDEFNILVRLLTKESPHGN